MTLALPRAARFRVGFLSGVALFVVLAGAPAALGQPQGAAAPAVGVVRAERQAVTESQTFVGRIEAVERVSLVARVTGFLDEVAFREGQEVQQGQLLFRIERAPFEATVESREAQVASAEADLANANIQLVRAQQLLRTNNVPRATVDEREAAAKMSAAGVAQAKAALRDATIELSYTEIKAPITGRIGRTTLTRGNVVSPSVGTLATIVSQDPMYVTFRVSQRDALDYARRMAERGRTTGGEGSVIRVRLADGTMYDQAGDVNFVDPQIDRGTDTLLVRASIPNPARRLLDGQTVTVVASDREAVQAIVLPRAAVVADQQGYYVFVVDEAGRAQLRRVRLGQSTPSTAVIAEGIDEGATVIVEGLQRVRPNAPVQAGPASAPVRPERLPG